MAMTPEDFAAELAARGIKVERITSSILTLSKRFTPGDANGYTGAETDVGIIYEVPQRDGSTWGTDGGSIGGAIGLQNGRMVLNRSGCHKRFLAKLAKLVTVAGA